MEIAKKKVFYTTFAALILSSFTLQTGKADEVQVKPDEAKIDYVNSEAPAPVAPQAGFSFLFDIGCVSELFFFLFSQTGLINLP